MKLRVKIFHETTSTDKDLILDGGPFLIGRNPNCPILLNDSSVSKIHGMISFHNGQLTLTDLYSLNGIWSNDNKVSEMVLSEFDIVQIGNYQLQFIQEETVSVLVDKTQEINLFEVGFLKQEDYLPLSTEAIFLPRADFLSHPLDEKLPELDLENSSLSNTSSIKTIIPGHSVEVTVMLGDDITSIHYLDLSIPEYFFSNLKGHKNTIYIPSTEKFKKNFIKISAGQVQLMPFDEVKLLDLSGNKSFSTPVVLEKSQIFIFDFGISKVYIRLSNQPPKLLPNKFFESDTLMNRATAAVGIIMLLLFAISPWMKVPEVVNEERVVAVIYKELPPTPEQKTDASSGSAPKTAQVKAVKVSGQKAFQATGLLKSMTKLLASSSSVSEVSASAPGKSTTDITMAQGGGRSPSSLGGGEVSGQGLSGGNGQKDVGAGLGGGGNKRGMLVGDVATRTVVLGSIDPDLLRKILQEYLPQFRHCYQKELDKNSNKIKGVIDLEFTIGKSGVVVKTNVKARDSGFSNDGVGCLSSILKIIKFPEPKGGGIVDVRQPLNFYSEDSKS
jgi:pSer/pThr/pTyr-binding forkhead associated (FHA) protein